MNQTTIIPPSAGDPRAPAYPVCSHPASHRRPFVVLPTFGTVGDLEPFILMARGLEARGYRVCLVATRDHAARLLETGLPHRLYGTVAQVEAVLDDPDLWDERKGLAVIGRGLADVMGEVAAGIASLTADGPSVALCHPFMLPAADIARARRPALRVVGTWLAPSNIRSVHDPLTLGPRRIPAWIPLSWRRALWRFVDRNWIDNVMLPGINAVRAAHRMAPAHHFVDHLGLSCDASIGLFPRWFAQCAPDWPTPFSEAGFPLEARKEPTDLGPEIRRFLDAGAPPVVVTLGTGMRHARTTFESTATALCALGRRGLFISRHHAQKPDHLPPGSLWVPHVPFADLLPLSAAIVHHGGIGTSAQALRAGIPQLVVASGFDQFDNGERLRSLNVADMLRATKATSGGIRCRLTRLLESSATRDACAAAKKRLEGGDQPRRFLDGVEAAISMCFDVGISNDAQYQDFMNQDKPALRLQFCKAWHLVIERTFKRPLRALLPAAPVER